MNFITRVFERADIQQIREFLLNGVECVELDKRSYKERIDEELQSAMEIITKKFPEMDEYEKITEKMFAYSGMIENVYMEVGLQCGMMLAMQMLTESGKN
ncbi:hypothetical protein SDC9_91083 [bioreactor metagenome]|uniref:Uncharacterized protein n=1 Tax=bioreactor metagenome TaxID=1076179 RepID=A0A644ZU51_9ZZZZ